MKSATKDKEPDEIDWKVMRSAFSQEVFALAIEQKQACKELLHPHIDDLQAVVEIAREDVDRKLVPHFLHKASGVRYDHSYKHPYMYPEGFCNEIAKGVLSRLEISLKRDAHEPAVQAIARLQDLGMPLHKVFGIITLPHGRFFQNALQIGDRIIDCGFDTGEKPKQKVVIWDTESGIFSGIKSYQRHAAVAQEYWMQRICPTARYFPLAAPFFPYLAVSPNGAVSFVDEHGIYFRNICFNFEISKNFVEKNAYQDNELPTRQRDYLHRNYRKREDMLRFDDSGRDMGLIFERFQDEWREFFQGKMEGEKKEKYYRTTREMLEVIYIVNDNARIELCPNI
ncbi:MAG TPA: hypothetical protein VJK03_00265 [Candidatus Nanoarchaeia archaeon]|nr:hypothetical protein [Candidatus Nanoarchaeia archaeon]